MSLSGRVIRRNQNTINSRNTLLQFNKPVRLHVELHALGPFKDIKVTFFSVVQEAMKRILKQKAHSYEVYIKSYRVMKSHKFHVRS